MAYDVRAEILDIHQASGETERFFTATALMRGRVPNSSRVWGHIPHIAKFQLPAGTVLQREGAGGRIVLPHQGNGRTEDQSRQ